MLTTYAQAITEEFGSLHKHPRRTSAPAPEAAPAVDPVTGKNGRPPTTAAEISLHHSVNIIDSLSTSDLYRKFERAFSDALGLPLVLRTVESWQLPYRGKRGENLFCGVVASKSRSCAACLRTTQRLSSLAADQPATITCPTGLMETAVAVRVNHRLIGFLQTGQVFNKAPTDAQFDRTAKLLSQWEVPARHEHLRDLYFGTRILTSQQQQAVVTLLTIFSQHLSIVGDQIAAWERHSEPPVITRAKAYIHEHQSEDLSLGQVARAVNASSFYFCKLFKKSTGINFVDYLSRLRIEKAKNLLLNPNCLISEIAFEVGFQSLTHFNRVFKKITGESPTAYRAQLPAP
jgi:AraC-like DNA-binding protein/ligand-binding sensor protein